MDWLIIKMASKRGGEKKMKCMPLATATTTIAIFFFLSSHFFVVSSCFDHHLKTTAEDDGDDEISSSTSQLRFPSNFLFGAASSAYQVR